MSSTYTIDSFLAKSATVARMRMLTGDSYAAQGRSLFTDDEMIMFVSELRMTWQLLAQKAIGYMHPEDIPDPVTAVDDRVEGTEDDFEAWNQLIRHASAEACLALSMRNPEWSPGRHRAYRVRAQELLPAVIDIVRY